MFDFHIHSKVSFDSESDPRCIVETAEKLGLREICFTDHYDFNDLDKADRNYVFSIEEYGKAYDSLTSSTVKIRRGAEFGLALWNDSELQELLAQRNMDFVIGSVHYAGGSDPYFPEFWSGISVKEAFEKFLLQTLECVRAQGGFDVLGHLNYVCKGRYNPTKEYLFYKDFADICDEIMKTVAEKGIGLEINTSGIDRVGDFLPAKDFIKRFRELGGEIITVGSDAHTSDRVGQYMDGALEIAKEVFGYVCTFENRKPIYHKL